MVTQSGSSQFEPLAQQILTIAVLSIIITAPIGAIGISVGGQALLNKNRRCTEDTEPDEIRNQDAVW